MCIETQTRLLTFSLFSFFILNSVISTQTLYVPLMQLVGFAIVVLSYFLMVKFVEKNMKERQLAQTINLVKGYLEPEKKNEAKKIEN